MTNRPRRRAAGGVIATWGRLIVVATVGLAQAPILFAHVPAAELGVWYLFFSVAAFINLSDLGLSSTVARAVSYRWGRDLAAPDAAEAKPAWYVEFSLPQIYTSALVATSVLGVAFALVSLPAALLYFDRTLPSADLQRTILPSLAIFLAGVVLHLVSSIPGACLNGSGDVALDNGIRATASVAGFAATWLLIPARGSLLVLCVIYVFQGAALLTAAHVALVRRRSGERWIGARASVALMRTLFGESGPFFVSRLGVWLTMESTLLLGAYFEGSERIADLGVLRQVVSAGTSVTIAIAVAIAPHVAAAHAAGDRQRVRSLFAAAVRFSLVTNVLWTIGLLLWAPSVLELLVGSQHFLGYAVLVPIALASFLEFYAGTHGIILWSVGSWPLAPYVISGGILNIALVSLGCAFFGFEGLAWGSLIAQGATFYWAEVVYALRALGLAIKVTLKETLVPALAYAAAVGTCGAALRAFYLHMLPIRAAPEASAAQVAYGLAAIGATTALAAMFAWVLVLKREDRTYFRQMLGIRR